MVAARNETVMRKNRKEKRGGKNEQKLSRDIFTRDISNKKKKKPSIFS